MNILAIDPGTKCGWALRFEGVITSGVWILNKKNLGSRASDIRYLSYFHARYSTVVYEDVKRHAGTRAAHVYGAIIAGIEMHCNTHVVACHSVPVGTIKKHATGKGNATKEMMVNAAIDEGFILTKDCDQCKKKCKTCENADEADALWILDYAIKKYDVGG